MFVTYKYRVKDKSARKTLSRHAYAANQIWNYCNALQQDIEARYKAGAPKRRWPSHFDLTALTAGVTKELGMHADTVGEVCRTFVAARNAAKRSLQFRSSFGARRALGWVPFRRQSRRIAGNSIIFLGRTYRVFGTKRRPIPDTAKGGAFVEDSQGRWWLTLIVEVPDRRSSSIAEVGIDLGLKTLATMSDGTTIENPRHLLVYAERLAVAQRAGNKRRSRAIHTKIANVRRDHHHKTSTRLSREYAFIAVGNVNAKALAKTKMAKSVLDAGWSAFRDMLRYKAARFVEVDERFTTQTCSACGCLPASRPRGIAGLGIRFWECTDCGASHDRDVNAARNILRIGRAVAAPVEESRGIAA